MAQLKKPVLDSNIGVKMKQLIVVIIIILMFLVGCEIPMTTYNGHIKFPDNYNMRDSLTPTFRWQSDSKEPCTYDFAISDSNQIEKISFWGISYPEFKDYIYYKEALSQPEHTVEVPLAPNTVYCFSVRMRSGDYVSSWASYDRIHFQGIFPTWFLYNAPYCFIIQTEKK